MCTNIVMCYILMCDDFMYSIYYTITVWLIILYCSSLLRRIQVHILYSCMYDLLLQYKFYGCFNSKTHFYNTLLTIHVLLCHLPTYTFLPSFRPLSSMCIWNIRVRFFGLYLAKLRQFARLRTTTYYFLFYIFYFAIHILAGIVLLVRHK